MAAVVALSARQARVRRDATLTADTIRKRVCTSWPSSTRVSSFRLSTTRASAPCARRTFRLFCTKAGFPTLSQILKRRAHRSLNARNRILLEGERDILQLQCRRRRCNTLTATQRACSRSSTTYQPAEGGTHETGLQDRAFTKGIQRLRPAHRRS